MDTKDFKKGGEAFYVDFSCRMFRSPKIEKTRVAEVWNDHVEDVQGRCFEKDVMDGRYGLAEKGRFNDCFLCPTEQDAMDMVEYKKLFLWLTYFRPQKKQVSLEDLRVVRTILDPDYKPKTQKSRLKAVNIKWDIDEEEDLEYLPDEIMIPGNVKDREEISDYLSDLTGFCHKGFDLIEI